MVCVHAFGPMILGSRFVFSDELLARCAHANELGDVHEHGRLDAVAEDAAARYEDGDRALIAIREEVEQPLCLRENRLDRGLACLRFVEHMTRIEEGLELRQSSVAEGLTKMISKLGARPSMIRLSVAGSRELMGNRSIETPSARHLGSRKLAISAIMQSLTKSVRTCFVASRPRPRVS